jgi:hypothetical protein
MSKKKEENGNTVTVEQEPDSECMKKSRDLLGAGRSTGPKGRQGWRHESRQVNQMPPGNKIKSELQVLKLLRTTTIQMQRLQEKSNEEKQVPHTGSKNQFFRCNFKQNYN